MNYNIGNVSEYLREHGIKPSYQRMQVFQYLMDNHIHPTVDMIYKALCPSIPTLSKTTVYNTLNLFVEKKIVNVIIIEENETRYEIAIHTHGHFKCNNCGEIFDIEIELDEDACKELGECEIEEQHFYFIGLCKTCKNK